MTRPARSLGRALTLASTLVAAVGCGAGSNGAFSHQFADNQSEDFAAVMERLPEPRPATAPGNSLGRALAVVTTHGEAGARDIVCIDVETGEERWRRTIDAMTRPEILGDLVLTSERHRVVALELSDGRERWEAELSDLAYVGATRDGNTIYYSATVGAQGGARRVGHVAALDVRTGAQRWRHEVEGVFGQPAAAGGVVIVPWERQNVAILDEVTGIELARLRSTDDVVAWTFDHPTGIYYGHRGIYRLTHRSVSGVRAESTHLSVPVPTLPTLREEEQEREIEIWDDGFMPKPGTRSARGRIRMYFRPGVATDPTHVAILGDTFYFVFYRYVFAYDLEGQLRWARVVEQDIVNAQPLADGLFVVGEQGRMRVLDVSSGLDRWQGGTELQLGAAALDVAGFAGGTAPTQEAPSLREVLSAIAVDPDNRLVTARAYAIERLAAMEDADITRDLLDLYAQQSMPGDLRRAIGSALQLRRSGAEHLVAALSRRYDFIENTQAPPLEVIVPSLVEMETREAVPGLVQQLNDHETPLEALPSLVAAITTLGDASVVPALEHFLTIYHADSTFAAAPDALNAAALGVFRLGGEDGRTWLTALADESRTLAPVTEAIRGFYTAEEAEATRLAAAEEAAAAAAAEAAAQRVEAELPTRLSQTQIDQTFAEHADPLRECVAGEIARNPLLGMVRLVFILESEGNATEVGVAPNTPELVACLQERVSAFEFPRFRQRRMRASYTIRIRGGAGEEEGAAPTRQSERIPEDAPWWTWWQRRGGDAAVSAGPAWWDRREAPAVAVTTTGATSDPTQGAGTTSTGGTGATSDPTQGTGTGTTGTGTTGGTPWWVGAGGDGAEEEAVEPEPPAPAPAPPAPTPRGRGRAAPPTAPAPTPAPPPAAPTPPPAAPPPAPPTPPPAPPAPAEPPAAPWWAPAEGGD